MLSERDKKMLLRGISMTRAVIKALRPECRHNDFILEWQNAIAAGFGLDSLPVEQADLERREFVEDAEEVNAAVRKIWPDYGGFITKLRGS